MTNTGTKALAALLASVALVAVAAPAMASDAKKTPFHVQVLDRDTDASALAKEGFAVHPMVGAAEEVPAPAERDSIFRQAGISDEIRDLDALDRDLLYQRARTLRTSELEKRYPNLKDRQIQRLQGLIQQRAGDDSAS